MANDSREYEKPDWLVDLEQLATDLDAGGDVRRRAIRAVRNEWLSFADELQRDLDEARDGLVALVEVSEHIARRWPAAQDAPTLTLIRGGADG